MRGKKVNGRRRQCRVAPNGFLLRVLVHPAAISAPAGAAWRLPEHHQSFPRMQDIRGDEGYTPGFNEERCQTTTIRLHVIEKPPGQKGFVVIPKRWVVERSIAWAGRNRLEVGAANNYSPQQPHSRIKRSLSLSWFYRNAPESALSEMLVFDHALRLHLRAPTSPDSRSRRELSFVALDIRIADYALESKMMVR